jgi:geranylgeranyl pyrophosphate synthase
MMIQGQVHDMRQDVVVAATAEERLSRCFRLKSASLYGAAAKMGGILTGADDDWLRCLVCEASGKAS